MTYFTDILVIITVLEWFIFKNKKLLRKIPFCENIKFLRDICTGIPKLIAFHLV